MDNKLNNDKLISYKSILKLEKNTRVYTSKGLSGLANIGNTCYMNSVLQCLSNSLKFTDYFFSTYKKDYQNYNLIKKKENLFVLSYFNLLQGLWDKNTIVKPRSFRENLCINIKKYFSLEQQDSHECLLYIFEILNKGLSYPVSMDINGKIQNEIHKLKWKKYEYIKNNFEKDYSIIFELFYGHLMNTLYCKNCDDSKNIYDSFPILTLNFPEKIEATFDIKELFDNTFQEEKVSVKCEKCKKKCIKKSHLIQTPLYLILHLNRFKDVSENKDSDKGSDKGSDIRKIDNLVKFPIENLDLTKYYHSSEQKNNWIYSLYAVNYHSGTIDNGHYWSSCKNLDDNWYVYNDANVSKLPSSDPNCIITKDAYMLFYHRVAI